MRQTNLLLSAAQDAPRSLETIRARAQMEHRVVVALEKLWTLSRIMAKYRVGPTIFETSPPHGLTVERPSTLWGGHERRSAARYNALAIILQRDGRINATCAFRPVRLLNRFE
jgi:hypothetical protein